MTFVWQRAAWHAANAKCFFASGWKQLHTFWSEPARDDRQAAVVTQEDQLVADREAIVGGDSMIRPTNPPVE